jgi:hypothetical protein
MSATSTKPPSGLRDWRGSYEKTPMFLILDTETTGLSPRDRIVSICWAIHDDRGGEVALEHHIIYPDGFTIPAGATAVHCITTEHAPAPAPLTERQLQRIRPLARANQDETARLQTRLAERQRALAAVYTQYALGETEARKLQEEIVELQRQLLASHHRMQQELRAVVSAEQFDRLRRRLEQNMTPRPASEGRRTARPQAPPARQP